jgi:hypothetical protein
VYVAAVPLRAPQGPAQALMSAGYSLGLWDLQHFMVLLRPDPPRTQVRPAHIHPLQTLSTPREDLHGGWLTMVVLQAPLVFDFQPRDPEDALAVFSVLSRSKIPGN